MTIAQDRTNAAAIKNTAMLNDAAPGTAPQTTTNAGL